MYKDEEVGVMRRGVRKILRSLVSQFDNDTERVLWLVIGAALKRRALTAAMLAGNFLAAVFEGGSLGILVLAVSVLLEPENAEGLSGLGTVGEFLTPVLGPLSRETTFLVLVSMGVVTQIIRAGLQYGATCASVYLMTSTQVALQERLIRHINAMTYEEINRHPSGEFTAYMGKTGTVANLLLTINQVILNTLLCLAYVVLMLWISWEIALAALAAVTVSSGLVSVLILRIREYGRMLATFSLMLGKHTMEYLQAPRLIRTFVREEDISRRWSEIVNDQMTVSRKAKLLQNMLAPLLDTLTIVLSGVIIIGGFYLFQGDHQAVLPVLLSFVVVLNRMMTRVISLNKLRSNISHLMPSAQMLAKLLRTDDKEMIQTQGKTVPELTTSIVVKGLYFSYRDMDAWVLRDINLEIRKGEAIAIVGSSGAGKTTLLDLLLGLYSPTMGTIMIDGVSLRDADPGSWRKQFCVVEQEPFFFNQSIRENLMFVQPDASDTELMNALAKAYIKDFVLTLPGQLDTVIGNRGYRLSGGQLQRLAIARAFLSEGNIMVFDEATSDLDSVSESYIKDSVRTIKGYKTIVTVAHRLSTVAESDCIVVLKEGRIEDRGTHDGLLARCEEYRELWKLQTGGADRVGHAD